MKRIKEIKTTIVGLIILGVGFYFFYVDKFTYIEMSPLFIVGVILMFAKDEYLNKMFDALLGKLK